MANKLHKEIKLLNKTIDLEALKFCSFIVLALIIGISLAYILGTWLGPNKDFLGLN